MGGPAVSSGADNQSSVAAYVAVRMLLERRLNWAGVSDDTPVALSGEVGGPGDDFRIEFGSRRSPLEVQSKRTLAGRASLVEAISDILAKLESVPSANEIVLTVGSGSSAEVRDVFATDVRNFRSGRRDSFRRITQAVLAEVADAEDVLSRLYVVTLDVEAESAAGSQFALDGLRQVLAEPNRAEEAWGLLVREGLRLAQRGRWDRGSLETFLRSHKFGLRPVGPDARWLEQIDYARNLNSNLRPRSAAGLLDHLKSEIQGKVVRPEVRRQLHGVRGACALALDDLGRARDEFGRALDHVIAPEVGGAPPPANLLKVWLDSRCNYGLLLHFHNDHAGAEAVAREILEWDSRHVYGWALLATTLDARDARPEPPPEDLLDVPEYRDSLAQIAMRRGLWGEAVQLRARMLSEGNRGPLRLNEHSQALINLSTELPDGVEKTRVLEEAERTADEAVATLANTEIDFQLARAHFVRGRAREALGRGTDATADYQRAASLAPRDTNVLMHAVHVHRRDGNNDGALALLTEDAVESSPLLRLLRAELRLTSDARQAARDDVERALQELPGIATGANLECYLEAADIALDLGQVDLAERAMTAVLDGGLLENGPEPGVIDGRIALARGDWARAETAYRAAAGRATGRDSARVLGELATRMSVEGRHEAAIDVYYEAGIDDPGNTLFQNLIGSLMQVGRYDRVVDLYTKLESDATMRGATISSIPSVLLDAMIDISWRVEDYATAARVLDRRILQDSNSGRAVSPRVLLAAAQAHAYLGGTARSSEFVDQVLALPALTSEDRMRAANVLVQIGAQQRAVDLAFAAVRACPSEKRIIANFINVVIAPTLHPLLTRTPRSEEGEGVLHLETGENGPTANQDVDDETIVDDYDDGDVGNDGHRGTVAGNCFVRVRTDDGQRYDYFIYADGPTDSRLNEYLLTDIAVVDLVGKSVGDIIVRNRGTWNEQRLRVMRVLPAVVVVFRRHMRTFAAQFPDEAQYRVFNVGRNPTLESLGPIMAAVHSGATQAEDALAKYSETPLPLAVLAKALQRPMVDVVKGLAADSSRRIHTDGPPFTEYSASVESAGAGATIVLTRPALLFLERLGLWDIVASRYQLVAPKSMIDEWDQEIGELDLTTKNGRVFLREAGARPVFDSIPAGIMNSALQESRSLYERVSSAASLRHRPISALKAKDDRWREILGAPSFDAIAIADSQGAVLYADDLGLRSIAAKEYGVPSFSTSALLDALHLDDTIPDDQFESAIVQLIEWGHDIVPVRATTIAAAFGSAGTTMRTAERVLSCLADPRISATSAAVVGAMSLRLLATTAVTAVTLDRAAEMVAEALIRDRDPQEIIPVYAAVLRDAFRLLPRQRVAIEAACGRFLKDKRLLRIVG